MLPRHGPKNRSDHRGCRSRTTAWDLPGVEMNGGSTKEMGVAHLWIREHVQGLLVGGVCLLQIILHEIAVP